MSRPYDLRNSNISARKESKMDTGYFGKCFFFSQEYLHIINFSLVIFVRRKSVAWIKQVIISSSTIHIVLSSLSGALRFVIELYLYRKIQ